MSWLLNSSPYFLLFVSVQEKILIATWDDNNKELLAFQWCSSKLASSADSSSCYSWVHGFFSDFNCQRALMTVCEVPFLSSLFIFNCFFIPCEARLAVQRTNVYHTGGKRTRLLFLIPDPTEPPRYAMMAVDISTDSLFALLLPPAASEKKTRKRDDYEKLSKSTEKGDLIKFEVISTGMKKQKKTQRIVDS